VPLEVKGVNKYISDIPKEVLENRIASGLVRGTSGDRDKKASEKGEIQIPKNIFFWSKMFMLLIGQKAYKGFVIDGYPDDYIIRNEDLPIWCEAEHLYLFGWADNKDDSQFAKCISTKDIVTI
jgi:hypothetical protein